ncbi:hypothetical protein, partial [Burkholderia sp. GS2Y]
SAALRFQQQRSEIMNRVSQLVNNFLLLRCDCGAHLRVLPGPVTTTPQLLRFPLPRRVSVSAKEA